MFSQTVEYALRAAVCLAQHPDEPLTSQQMAEITKVPQGYLSKILQQLVRSDLVSSRRGLGGGFVLIRRASEISIYDIAAAIEPVQRIRTCPLNLPNHGTHLCALHRRMDEALLAVETALRQSTLQELVDDPNPSRPLCNESQPQG